MSKKRPKYVTRVYLEKMYLTDGKSAESMAKELKVSSTTIKRWLKQEGIPRRTLLEAHSLSFAKRHEARPVKLDFLRDEYLKKGKSALRIAKETGISDTFIKKTLRNSGVKLRTKNEYTANINHMWKGVGKLSGSYWSRLLKNARVREIEVTISIEYAWELFVKQDELCALTGIKLFFANKTEIFDGTASLDRISSELGYIPGNVQWVHKTIQEMKMDQGQTEFKLWCGRVAAANPIYAQAA